jgi:hypothetical protein
MSASISDEACVAPAILNAVAVTEGGIRVAQWQICQLVDEPGRNRRGEQREIDRGPVGAEHLRDLTSDRLGLHRLVDQLADLVGEASGVLVGPLVN